jgi:hypothetical protein
MAVFQAGCSLDMSSGYSFDFQGEQASRTEHTDIPAEVETVDLTNLFGNVTITASENEDAAIDWNLACWADTEQEAVRLTEQVQFICSTEGNSSRCEIVLPDGPQNTLRGVKSNITISLPASMKIRAVNSHGDICATDLSSEVELKNRFGKLTVQGLTKPCDLENSHGEVLAERITSATIKTSHGKTTVRTVSESLLVRGQHSGINVQHVDGNVDVATSHHGIDIDDVGGDATITCSHGAINGRRLRGQVVVTETSHGSTDLETLATSVSCSSQHGKVALSATNPDLKSVEVSASFHDIHLTLANGLNPAITTSATFGEVDSDFAGKGSSPTIGLNVKHGGITIRQQRKAEQE